MLALGDRHDRDTHDFGQKDHVGPDEVAQRHIGGDGREAGEVREQQAIEVLRQGRDAEGQHERCAEAW